MGSAHMSLELIISPTSYMVRIRIKSVPSLKEYKIITKEGSNEYRRYNISKVKSWTARVGM
jgi:hypothetical protein